MTSEDVLSVNRVLLTHFDSYSTALVFAKWGDTLLFPAPLAGSATLAPAPDGETSTLHDDEAVMAATVARLGLNADELMIAKDFNHWASSDNSLVRIHLLRFTTMDAPKALLATHGAVFKPISELRGSPRIELELAREVFNLIIGAGGGRA